MLDRLLQRAMHFTFGVLLGRSRACIPGTCKQCLAGGWQATKDLLAAF